MVEFPNHGLRDQLRVCKSTEMKPITTLASEKFSPRYVPLRPRTRFTFATIGLRQNN